MDLAEARLSRRRRVARVQISQSGGDVYGHRQNRTQAGQIQDFFHSRTDAYQDEPAFGLLRRPGKKTYYESDAGRPNRMHVAEIGKQLGARQGLDLVALRAQILKFRARGQTPAKTRNTYVSLLLDFDQHLRYMVLQSGEV